MQAEGKHRAAWVAPTLDDAHRQSAVPRPYGKPQGGGRRSCRGGSRPPQDGQGGPAPGGHLETAQGAGIRIPRRPGQDAGEATAQEQLLAAPGGFLPSPHDDQAFQGQAGGGPGGGMGPPGRRHQGNPSSRSRKSGQGGQEQAEFAAPREIAEQFGQVAPGPAATGQLGVQGRVAGGDAVLGRQGQGTAPPDVTPRQDVPQPRHSGVGERGH